MLFLVMITIFLVNLILVSAGISGGYASVFGEAEGSTVALWAPNDCNYAYNGLPEEYSDKLSSYRLIQTLEFRDNLWKVRAEGCCLSEDYCYYDAGLLSRYLKWPGTNSDIETSETPDGKEWVHTNNKANACYTAGSIIGPWGSYKLYCAKSYSKNQVSEDYAWIYCDNSVKGEIASGNVYCDGNIWKSCGSQIVTTDVLWPNNAMKSDNNDPGCCQKSDDCVRDTGACISTDTIVTQSPPAPNYLCHDNDFYFCSPDQKAKNKIFQDRFLCDGAIWNECTTSVKTINGFFCDGNGKWTSDICDDNSLGNLKDNDKYICNSTKAWQECKASGPGKNVETKVGEKICGNSGKWVVCGDGDSCQDSVCWKYEDCKDASCDKDNDEKVVVWSFYPSEWDEVNLWNRTKCCNPSDCVNLINPGPSAVTYCQKDGELRGEGPEFPPTDEYILCEENNWIICNENETGKINLKQTHYCDGAKWLAVETNCTNGVDDGGVIGLGDCADPTCNGKVGGPNGEKCEQPAELTCNDGFDNNGDTTQILIPPKIDSPNPQSQSGTGQIIETNCKDGKDTDNDGSADCLDPDCNQKQCSDNDQSGFCELNIYNPGTVELYYDIVDVFYYAYESSPRNLYCSHHNYFIGPVAMVGKETDSHNSLNILDCCKALNKSYANGVLCQKDNSCSQYANFKEINNFTQEVPEWGGSTPVWQYACYKSGQNYQFQGTCQQPNGYVPEAGHEKECADNTDNDGDGLKDCYDPDCHLSPSCCIDPDKTAQELNSSSWDKSFLVKGFVLGWWGQYTDDWIGQAGEEKFGVRSDYCSDKSNNWAKVDQCNGEDCYLREMSCETIGPITLTTTGAYKCPDGCVNGICKKVGEFLEAKDCLDSGCVADKKQGPQGAQCCFTNNDCNNGTGVGAICVNTNNECKETTCNDGIDNDGDGLADCEDLDCNALPCSKEGVCYNKQCLTQKGPEQATIVIAPEVKIFSYLQLLQEINKCQVVKEEGACNNVCKDKTCLFADGGRKSCTDPSSTKCTCC